jgi:hypothetical protein
MYKNLKLLFLINFVIIYLQGQLIVILLHINKETKFEEGWSYVVNNVDEDDVKNLTMLRIHFFELGLLYFKPK